jgi:uncharacterized C2H2 Zn-finger protein
MSDLPPNLIFEDDDDFDGLTDIPEQADNVCPECGNTFKNARGVALHLAKAHDIHKSGSDSKPSSLKTRKSNLEKELTAFFTTIGLFVSLVPKCSNDGFIIQHNAESLATAWSHLAQQNKTVDRVLRSLMSASATGEVVMAMTMTIIPIMANHDMLPSEVAFMFNANASVPTNDI